MTESESDSDVYQAARRKTTGKKQRRQVLQGGSDSGPTHAEVRFSTRKAAKVSNYNEDDEDMFEEDDPEILTPNYWASAADESILAIDAILNHRLREGISKAYASPYLTLLTPVGKDLMNPGRDDFEYHVRACCLIDMFYHVRMLTSTLEQVKWQGKAHYHATWENNATLASCRGIRRLENYFRKVVQEDIHMMHDEDIPPEEKEKWSLDRERDADALIDHMKVERVISTREGENGDTEYFVKCMSGPVCAPAFTNTSQGRVSITSLVLGNKHH